MRKLNLTESEKKERRRIAMLGYSKKRREKDKLNGVVKKKNTDEQNKLYSERAKAKRLKLKEAGLLILTDKQKEAKKIRDRKYRKKLTLEGKNKKLSPEAKIKRKEYLVVYNEKNKDFIKERSKFFYKKRKESGKIDLDKAAVSRRKYYSINRDKINKNNRDKYSKNIELEAIKRREKFLKNPDKIRERNNEYVKLKKNTSPTFAIRTRIGRRLSYAFSTFGNKKPYNTEELLGADWITCKNHLESLFKNGISWENRNLWHIDHIIPLASAKTEEEMIKLCHYTNLQPLWAIDNIKKGAKMPINI